MNFNTHSRLEGQHAFLSPSNYHWVNYDDDKLDVRYHKAIMARLGTQRHEFAHHAISMGVKLADTPTTLNMYVNDAIGFRMQSEQRLYYSENCFGTADAISFRDNLLRVHDLKNGDSPTSMKQLEVYAALFCLEYGYNPFYISMETRIYQHDAIEIHIPDPDDIMHIMDKIITFDKRIEQIKAEEAV